MAGNAKIKVVLGDGIVAELDNDAPNVKEFVKVITANRDSIDVERIVVEGPTSEFDEDSFKEIIVEVVTDYIEAITIEEEEYLRAIGEKGTGSENGGIAVEEDDAKGLSETRWRF